MEDGVVIGRLPLGLVDALVGSGNNGPLPLVSDGASTPIYSGPTFPHAFYDAASNKTWFTYEAAVLGGSGADPTRVPRVGVYDHAAQQISNVYRGPANYLNNDSHGNGAICIDSQNNTHLFWTPHIGAPNGEVAAGQIFHAVSTTKGSPDSFGGAYPFASQSEYPTPIRVGSSLYVLCRNTVSNDLRMSYYLGTVTTTSGNTTWAAVKDLITNGTSGRIYWASAQVRNSTEIHFIAQKADLAETQRWDVGYFILDTTTGNLLNYDRSHTALAAALPLSLADFDTYYRIVATVGTYYRNAAFSLAFDSADNAHIMYADNATADVFYIANFGSGWTSPVQLGSHGSYVETGALVPSSDGGMDAYWIENCVFGMGNGGDVVTNHRTSGSVGTWGTKTTVQKASNGRGIYAITPVLNGTDGFRVMWFECLTSDNDNTAGVGSVRGWAYSHDTGYLKQHATPAKSTSIGWAPLTKSPNQAVTADLATVTSNAATAQGGIIANFGSIKGQKCYFEVLIGNDANNNESLGVGIAAFNYNNAKYPGFGSESIIYYDDGKVQMNNGYVKTGWPTWTTGDRICVAFTNGPTSYHIWWRKNGGNWNNDPTADPATDTGGVIHFSGWNELFPALDMDSTGNSVTRKFDSSDWAFTPPSGFTAPGSIY